MSRKSDILYNIAWLSRKYGGSDYVKGGGGNSSAKDQETIWVKPSGCKMLSMEVNQFVALSRHKLLELNRVKIEDNHKTREEITKGIIQDSVLPGSKGRASVEAPLHNLIAYTYIVHTHPAIVNGMTCAKDGQVACRRLFPDAMWVDYVDPGITLYHVVKEKIKEYEEIHGGDPKVIFLKNHGVFVASDSVDEIEKIYEGIFETLKQEYNSKGIQLILAEESIVLCPNDLNSLVEILSESELKAMTVVEPFKTAEGPVTPDHMVYMKSFPHIGEISKGSVKLFESGNGYLPRIFSTSQAVYAIGESDTHAQLSVILARDGALVKQLAEAFGGIDYLSKTSREFIENWEVESYRRNQI